jgi:ferric-dicitrate binding protein FerR (iron transport regulator)
MTVRGASLGKRARAGLWLAVAAAALAVPGAARADDAGKVVRLRGDATVEAAGSAAHRLSVDESVAVGARLKTGPGARLEVKLVDGTDITLGERADFTIDMLTLTPTAGTGLFHRVSGAFLMLAGEVSKRPEHRMEVASNVATIGIRGTQLWGGSVKSALDVFLIEGSVEVSTAAGRIVLERPGDGTSVQSAESAPSAPTAWAVALRDRALATVSFDQP